MNEFEKELEKIKQKIYEVERKYRFVRDYNLITSLLNKLDVDEIEINIDEISDKNIYIVENNYKENKVVIKRGE